MMFEIKLFELFNMFCKAYINLDVLENVFSRMEDNFLKFKIYKEELDEKKKPILVKIETVLDPMFYICEIVKSDTTRKE